MQNCLLFNSRPALMPINQICAVTSRCELRANDTGLKGTINGLGDVNITACESVFLKASCECVNGLRFFLASMRSVHRKKI